MKKCFTVIFFVILISANYSQTKYMIYFKDKGITSPTALMKSSTLFEAAAKELTPKAIERRKKVMGENYITFEDLPVNRDYVDQIESHGIKIANKLKWFNAVSCFLTDEQFSEIKQLPSVQKIEAVKILSSPKPIVQFYKPEEIKPQLKKTATQDYGSSLTQNALSEIPAVHDLGITGEGVIIGILDTGFRWKTHPSLQNKNVIGEYDFINKDEITENQAGDTPGQDSHGTSVFSIMAGYDPGNLIGPAYRASFLLTKTEDIRSEKNVEEDNYAAALEWMEAQGVDITSSSLGYSTFDDSLYSYTYLQMDGKTTIVAKAADQAFKRGVSTFTSAGNGGNDPWHYISSPADAFNMIAVGAVDYNNLIAGFSSRGPSSDGRIKPEIVAMGVSVYNAIKGTTGYGYGSGTSYSAPIAAGIAGLLKSAYPHLTNSQIRKIFLESCDNTASPNNDSGYGLISAKKAVCYPNLEVNATEFILHKIFINNPGVNASTVNVNYKINNSDFVTAQMVFDGKYKFQFSFPALQNGQQIEFYFSFNDLSGNLIREPEGIQNYKFSYGSNQVSLITGINNGINELPGEFYLSQNYPNPFNPETTISYKLPSSSQVSLKVFDILGGEVATLVNEYLNAGVYHSTFSTLHSAFSSGVYFYRLSAGNFVQTKKMLLIK